ncbi:MAG: nitroreductase family protein [Desulfobacterales bacterium]|nr:MAG: nitroreductase family protein [Desulfobacterales bacterium]
METLEAIHTRRSIRKFKPQPVPKDLIHDILAAAMTAPSAGNQQPWQFVVITDRKILDRIPEINPYASMAKQAALAILICGDLSLEKFPGNWVLDCSAAVQNLLLAAHDKGLGAVWTGIYPDKQRMEDFQQLVGLPQHVVAHTLVPMGYPNQKLSREDRFKQERIHYNHWPTKV